MATDGPDSLSAFVQAPLTLDSTANIPLTFSCYPHRSTPSSPRPKSPWDATQPNPSWWPNNLGAKRQQLEKRSQHQQTALPPPKINWLTESWGRSFFLTKPPPAAPWITSISRRSVSTPSIVASTSYRPSPLLLLLPPKSEGLSNVHLEVAVPRSILISIERLVVSFGFVFGFRESSASPPFPCSRTGLTNRRQEQGSVRCPSSSI